jgi:hypothetical protein
MLKVLTHALNSEGDEGNALNTETYYASAPAGAAYFGATGSSMKAYTTATQEARSTSKRDGNTVRSQGPFPNKADTSMQAQPQSHTWSAPGAAILQRCVCLMDTEAPPIFHTC